MIVAFDFDGVASDRGMQHLIKKMVMERNEIWIVTMRKENDFSKEKLSPVLALIGLSFSSVIFCNEKPKFEVLKIINADIYIDNISTEFVNIFNHSNTVPLLFQSLN